MSEKVATNLFHTLLYYTADRELVLITLPSFDASSSNYTLSYSALLGCLRVLQVIPSLATVFLLAILSLQLYKKL